jgi:antibiotic biosynthesis monooxygenase (ABM) superfamily enzyme
MLHSQRRKRLRWIDRLMYMLRKQRKQAVEKIYFYTPMSQPSKPPRHKVFLLTWLAIYPLVTGMFLLFGKQLNLLPLPIRTLLLTFVLVYLMTYVIMPRLMIVFHGWLYPNSK